MFFDYDEKNKIVRFYTTTVYNFKTKFNRRDKRCNDWIHLAKERNIGWWITSALESNIGLNAIAQYTFTLNNKMPQGLGTVDYI